MLQLLVIALFSVTGWCDALAFAPKAVRLPTTALKVSHCRIGARTFDS